MNSTTILTEPEAELRALGAQIDHDDGQEESQPSETPAGPGETGEISEGGASAATTEDNDWSAVSAAADNSETAEREESRGNKAEGLTEGEQATHADESSATAMVTPPAATTAVATEPPAPSANAETKPAAVGPLEEKMSAFQRQWWETVQQQLQETPELQDGDSPLGRAVQAILKEDRIFSLVPEGFRHAAALAKARAEAAALPALQSKLQTLARENERLVQLTSVTGTPPARTGRGVEAGAASERDLRRMAAEFDLGG